MSERDVVVVILAAGASQRLGVAKQLVQLAGEALLRRQCRCALSADIGATSVILGSDAERHAPTIADLPIEIQINQDWAEGMAASLRHAVDIAARRRAACLILPCDQYRITPNDLQTLFAAWHLAPWLACMSRWAEYAGPPVIVPGSYYRGISQLRGNLGARALLRDARRPAPLEVPNVRAPYDLDCTDDIAVAQAWAAGTTDEMGADGTGAAPPTGRCADG